MVIKRKWMPIEMVETILSENKTAEEKLDKLGREINNLPTREPKPPAPEGGISLRVASKKYGICHQTLSSWRKKGIIKTLLETANEIYVDEVSVSTISSLYKQNPGRGKRTHLTRLKNAKRERL